MTPDEYCDGIIGIAFDRETTKAAFAKGVDVGFAAGQADANDMLTIAHMDGYSKGRDAMQRELEADAAATKWRPMETAPRHYTKRIRVRNRRGSEFFVAWAQSNCWLDDDGDERDPIEWLPLIPMPSPDVRELVEALEWIANMKPHFAGQTPNEVRMQSIAAKAVTKHRGQS